METYLRKVKNTGVGGAGGKDREKAVRSSGRGGRRGKNKKARAVGRISHWIRNMAKTTVVHGATRSSTGKQPSTDYSLAGHAVPP